MNEQDTYKYNLIIDKLGSYISNIHLDYKLNYFSVKGDYEFTNPCECGKGKVYFMFESTDDGNVIAEVEVKIMISGSFKSEVTKDSYSYNLRDISEIDKVISEILEHKKGE